MNHLLAGVIQEEDFVYSTPMLLVMRAKRVLRNATRSLRKVDVAVNVGLIDMPDGYYDSWQYYICLEFSQALPAIHWDQMKAFNRLLSMTATDRLLIGVNFITIYTANPEEYDFAKLAALACDAFGLELDSLKDNTTS